MSRKFNVRFNENEINALKKLPTLMVWDFQQWLKL